MSYDCMIKDIKEGLDTENDLIKMLFAFLYIYLMDSVRIMQLLDYNYMYVTMQS